MQLTENEREIIALKELTTTLFTWEEVKKLIAAYGKTYDLGSCHKVPYQVKGIKVFTSVQIVDLEKLTAK